MDDAARVKVLVAADEEVPIWELTAAIRTTDLEGQVSVEPAQPVEDVQPALLALLAERRVELYDFDDPTHSSLPGDEGLSVAGDMRYWNADSAPRRILLVLTDAGEMEFQSAAQPKDDR